MKTNQKAAAEQWVRENTDSDDLSEHDLCEAFTSIYGRQPDAKDRADGLWSLLCAAVD